MYWLKECPIGDQGQVGAAILTTGRPIMVCDVCGTVWCSPDDVDDTPEAPRGIVPSRTDFIVCGGDSMKPGVGWADRFDLKRVGWANHEWHHYEWPVSPLFFVVPYPDLIYKKAQEWLLGDEAATLEASAQAAANTFLRTFITTANDTVGYVDFRDYLDQLYVPGSWKLSPVLSDAGRAIRLMLNRASSAIGRPRKEWDRIP